MDSKVENDSVVHGGKRMLISNVASCDADVSVVIVHSRRCFLMR
jgi:hypothetical protein